VLTIKFNHFGAACDVAGTPFAAADAAQLLAKLRRMRVFVDGPVRVVQALRDGYIQYSDVASAERGLQAPERPRRELLAASAGPSLPTEIWDAERGRWRRVRPWGRRGRGED